MAEIPRYKNLINGQWAESSADKYFEKRNPSNTDEVVGEFVESSADEINPAVDDARESYRSWRAYPAPKRAEILFRAAERIAHDKEALASDMTREMGKVLKEAQGDV